MRFAKGCMLAAVGMLVFGASVNADTVYFAWEVEDVDGIWKNTPTFPGDPQQDGKPVLPKVEFDITAWPGMPSEAVAVPYKIWIAIEENDPGFPSSQGLSSFSLDIATNTGIVQPKPTFAKTKTLGPQTILNDNWAPSGVYPYVAHLNGFGFSGLSDQGNNTAVVGSVIGPGAGMNPLWTADVAPQTYNPGLQPKALHNVGYGAPPGIDVGGTQTPSLNPRGKWFLLEGEILVPHEMGTYYVDIIPGQINVIDPTRDLNVDQTGGYQIAAKGVIGGGWVVNVIPEPATLSVLLFAGVGLVVRRRR